MQFMSLFCGQQLSNTVPEPFRRNLKLSCLFRYNVHCIQGHFPWKQVVQKSGTSIILNFSDWLGEGVLPVAGYTGGLCLKEVPFLHSKLRGRFKGLLE